MHCTKAMQASFGQDLTELPADELLVLTDDVFLVLYGRNHSRLRAWLDAGDQQTALSRVDRSVGVGTADRRAAGPPHPPRAHPGDERRELPPQAEQAQTQPSTRPLNHHYSSRGGWRLPLRPKRGPQTGPQASAPDATLTAKPHPPHTHLV